jgi:hypothetical protein
MSLVNSILKSVGPKVEPSSIPNLIRQENERVPEIRRAYVWIAVISVAMKPVDRTKEKPRQSRVTELLKTTFVRNDVKRIT